MSKLRLDTDDLRIDSFPTAHADRESGTAAAYITQGANTCYHCTRWGCPATGLC
jgi:hypothetical protein